MTAGPPARVEQAEGSAGVLEIATRNAPAHLRHLAGEYHGYAEYAGYPGRSLEGPIASAVLILGTGTPIAVSTTGEPAGFEPAYRGFVAGLSDQPALVEWMGAQAGVQLNLTPPGARQLLGLPMSEVTGRAVHLDDLLGREGDALVERLAAAPGWEQRFAIVDAFLDRRLAACEPPPADIAWAWAQVVGSGGNVSIGWLASRTAWSHKHFVDRFRREIGLTPRLFARVVRFERACRLAARRDRPAWAALAAECGYYDQAHLVREFRAFARCTPREYVARQLPGTTGPNT